MRIFVDTGAWIAIADKNDQYAKIATKFYTDLIIQRSNLFTSNLVLVETFNLLSRTIGSKGTTKFGDALKTNVFLTVESLTLKDFSFTDCTSFALMERLKVKSAFAFDVHFRQYGFS